MVFAMKRLSVEFGVDRNLAELSLAQGFEAYFDDGVLSDIQAFIDHIPALNSEEVFYFGFWRMKIRRTDGGYRLCEWNFQQNEFEDELGRSVLLWYTQRDVLQSQKLAWSSVGISDIMHCTPSVFSYPQDSVIEGVRDSENVRNSSGWILYTASDRHNNLSFESIPLHDALKDFNVNVLRFLCLPDGWTFNIEVGGESHIWKQTLAERPPN